jgi:hypothetical protein
MLGCEAVLRHISKSFGDAKMYLEPAPSTSFAWLGPGKQVHYDAKLPQSDEETAHETSYAVPRQLRTAAEHRGMLPLLLLQAERVQELDLLCPGLRTADPTATR